MGTVSRIRRTTTHLTIDQAASAIGRSERVVRALVAAGRLDLSPWGTIAKCELVRMCLVEGYSVRWWR